LPFASFSALEKLLTDWIDFTNGEFQILQKNAECIMGRYGPQASGKAGSSVIKSPVPSTISPSLTSLSGAKVTAMAKTVSYGFNQVEVRATIKGSTAFSVLCEPSSNDPCGQVVRISCSSINDAAWTNTWTNKSDQNVMAALTQILGVWVEERSPSVSVFFAYLRTYTDLFKANCCSCNRWIIEDGVWGPLPPLYNVTVAGVATRKHFTCPTPL
jgi:hypothetical protein